MFVHVVVNYCAAAVDSEISSAENDSPPQRGWMSCFHGGWHDDSDDDDSIDS